MKQKLHIVTLGVRDLVISTRFYRDVLGWTPAQQSNDSITFFPVGGFVLALYNQQALAEDATVNPQGSGFKGFTLAHLASSVDEVDQIMEQASQRGAIIAKPAQKVFWGGYSGYFQDPDGHLIEVAHNPFVETDDRGLLVM